jgi:hypothetical protein
MWLSAIKLAAQAGTHIFKKASRDKNAHGGCTNDACKKDGPG